MAGVTRVGATKQYSDNWDNIFAGKRRTPANSGFAPPARTSAKKTPKKKRSSTAAKKPSRRK